MRKKITIFLAGAIVCLGFAWYWYNKPRESVAFKPTVAAVSAAKLYEAYASNEDEGDKMYLNKIIEVKGTVVELTYSGEDIILTLEAQSTSGGISCRFSPGKEIVKKQIRKEMEISVKGRCTGFNMDVNLTDCVIVK